MSIDEELDRFFFSTKDQRVETAYTVALSAYFDHAKQIRSMRPDVLMDEQKKLKEELGLVKRRIAHLERQANDLTVERDRLVTFDLKVLREERDCLNAKVSALLSASRDDRWSKDRILESVDQLLAVVTCLRDNVTIPGYLLDNVRYFVRSKTGEWNLSDSVRTEISQCVTEHTDLDTIRAWALVEQLDVTLEALNAQPKAEWPLGRVLRLLEDMNEDIHREFQDGAREGMIMRHLWCVFRDEPDGSKSIEPATLRGIQAFIERNPDCADAVKSALEEVETTLAAANELRREQHKERGQDFRS